MRRYVIALLPLLFIGCKHTERMDRSRLKVPAGFSIEVFGQAPQARMMAFSPWGVLLVTSTSDGKVLALPDSQHRGKAERASPFFRT